MYLYLTIKVCLSSNKVSVFLMLKGNVILSLAMQLNKGLSQHCHMHTVCLCLFVYAYVFMNNHFSLGFGIF